MSTELADHFRSMYISRIEELEGALKESEAKALQLSQKLSIAYAKDEALAGTK
jgi:hypothetical protein